jgi:glucose-1-phosphate cytidylyltransferase
VKIIILCGGKGTRLSEETQWIPKPMVKIGNKPILVHIMQIYMKYGFKDFIIALGYKGKIIKDYFKLNPLKNVNIKCINTKQDTLTAGRILLLKKYLNKNEDFMVTYGDGVADIDIKSLISFHKKNNKILTLTAVMPPLRFGSLQIDKQNFVKTFDEKPLINNNWINGGFFVMKYSLFNFIKNTQQMLEQEPIQKLSQIKQVKAYKHKGFWQCMDTLREKKYLNSLWFKGKAKWKP